MAHSLRPTHIIPQVHLAELYGQLGWDEKLLSLLNSPLLQAGRLCNWHESATCTTWTGKTKWSAEEKARYLQRPEIWDDVLEIRIKMAYAMVVHSQGQYKKALQTLQGVQKRFPMVDFVVYTNIGHTYWKMGKREEAQAAWEKAVALSTHMLRFMPIKVTPAMDDPAIQALVADGKQLENHPTRLALKGFVHGVQPDGRDRGAPQNGSPYSQPVWTCWESILVDTPNRPTRKVEVEDLGEIIRSSMKATGSDWLLPHSASGGDAGASTDPHAQIVTAGEDGDMLETVNELLAQLNMPQAESITKFT